MNKKLVLLITIAAAILIAIGVGWFIYFNQPSKLHVMGRLVEATPTSVTIVLEGGTQKTFALTKNTTVASEVKDDSYGLTPDELQKDTMLRILPAANNGSTAAYILVFTIVPPPLPSPLGPTITKEGEVTAKEANSFTLKSDTGNIHVMIDAKTVAYSYVHAGQRGKTAQQVAVGDRLTVSGVAGTGGLNAQLIQYAQN